MTGANGGKGAKIWKHDVITLEKAQIWSAVNIKYHFPNPKVLGSSPSSPP